MTRFRVFSIFIFSFVSFASFAQYRITGTVTSRQDSTKVKECSVYLNDEKNIAITDASGKFVFTDLSNGNYTIYVVCPGYRHSKSIVTIDASDQNINILLYELKGDIEEVLITEKQQDFGFTRMRAVENMGIYEGKKSEVIIPDQLVANLATNNARQVYARVAGLNIWENDGAGLQLSIGGRGLDPNRTSNFNVRQNGYDISADALGYPESYYTPPIEAVGRIQIVRGAASLQYGTQFGGLINFMMKKPVANKRIEWVARQSVGSYGFYNTFTSASGTIGRLSYYTFFQYKRGDGWRANSHFDNHTYFGNINYQLSDKTKIGLDITRMAYLAQQPGGLSDAGFYKNPRQSLRSRNWFKVNWNLFALHFDHKFNPNNEFNLRVFALLANRYSLGFRPNRVESQDDNSERDLIKGNFENWGAEARYLKRYSIFNKSCVLLVGSRYYHGYNEAIQGLGSKGKDADFNFINPDLYTNYNYQFPNRNVSLFAENIFYLHEKLSVTPGVRYEYINTTAKGFYGTIFRDNANNILVINKTNETRSNERQFVLGGIGLSYKPASHINIYSNISQNYRSITFSDMQISNPSSVIDPDMKDEKGYSFDVGIRSEHTALLSYDLNVFYLNYNDRIGEVQFTDEKERILRKRTNIGQAVISGVESYAESDLLRLLNPRKESWSGVLFMNMALIQSVYKSSNIPGVKGNQVEFVPKINMKSGFRLGYKDLKVSFQYTYLSSQYSDATNAVEGGASAVIGIIPSYTIMDASLSYQYKWMKIEASINNLANQMYFTRRATGYPGPGILPSDGRSFYVTLQVKLSK